MHEFWTNDWREVPKGEKGYLAFVERPYGLDPRSLDGGQVKINGVVRDVIKARSSVYEIEHYELGLIDRMAVWVKR